MSVLSDAFSNPKIVLEIEERLKELKKHTSKLKDYNNTNANLSKKDEQNVIINDFIHKLDNEWNSLDEKFKANTVKLSERCHKILYKIEKLDNDSKCKDIIEILNSLIILFERHNLHNLNIIHTQLKFYKDSSERYSFYCDKYDEDCQQLKSSCDEYEIKNANLRSQIDYLKSDIDELKSENNQLLTDRSELSSDLQYFKQRCDRKDDLNNKLRCKVYLFKKRHTLTVQSLKKLTSPLEVDADDSKIIKNIIKSPHGKCDICMSRFTNYDTIVCGQCGKVVCMDCFTSIYKRSIERSRDTLCPFCRYEIVRFDNGVKYFQIIDA